MNKLMKQAFEEAGKLPEDGQETIARMVLDEIEAERGWDERFTASQDQLAALVRRAREEVARGEVLPHDPSDRRQA